MDASVIAAFVTELKPLLGDRVSTGESVRALHSRDQSRLAPVMPDVVVFPETEAEVQAVLAACHRLGLPVTPFGVGSSMEGHTIPIRGGVTLSTQKMNRIREILPEDMLAVVEPGVTRMQLNTELRATGLMFSVDPGADASIGGMASTRGSGTTAVRYGTMRENVLALRAVMADGTAIKTGSRARKSSTGYDLTHLFVGAEGTLGVITELTVRLHPIPEAVSAAVCAFPTTEAAIDTVIQTIQSGIPVARSEFLDEVAIANVNRYSGLTMKVAPTLLFEFHGTEAGVAEQAARVQDIAEGNGAEGFQWSTDADDRARLWKARHDLFWATKSMVEGHSLYTGDICVPISKLADQITAARADIEASYLPGQIIGHVGDGNYHAAILFDPDKPEDFAEAERLNKRMVERALAVGGTASGEHGIGIVKLPYMLAEHGAGAVDAMRAIKRALDPTLMMNPGKMGHGG